jgi:hypothetical protein
MSCTTSRSLRGARSGGRPTDGAPRASAHPFARDVRDTPGRAVRFRGVGCSRQELVKASSTRARTVLACRRSAAPTSAPSASAHARCRARIARSTERPRGVIRTSLARRWLGFSSYVASPSRTRTSATRWTLCLVSHQALAICATESGTSSPGPSNGRSSDPPVRPSRPPGRAGAHSAGTPGRRVRSRRLPLPSGRRRMPPV